MSGPIAKSTTANSDMLTTKNRVIDLWRIVVMAKWRVVQRESTKVDDDGPQASDRKGNEADCQRRSAPGAMLHARVDMSARLFSCCLYGRFAKAEDAQSC